MCFDPGGGPFPAVLDLYTFGGGLSEKRASLLASHGFVVLTVALYGHDDMPKYIKVVNLDYFEEAIKFLKKQDKVSGLNSTVQISFFGTHLLVCTVLFIIPSLGHHK